MTIKPIEVSNIPLPEVPKATEPIVTGVPELNTNLAILNAEEPEFVGETYDDFNEPEEDIVKAIKVAAAKFLENETVISKLNLKIETLKEDKKRYGTPENVKLFIQQAFPQVTTPDSALQMISYLIGSEQYLPNSWFNMTTFNQTTNKLELIKALIDLGMKGENDT